MSGTGEVIMILIIGGAYQGKLDYVHENYKTSEESSCSETTEPDFSKEVLNRFHLFILHQIRSGVIASDWIKQNSDLLKDKIIICDDISCGVVPIEEELRLWREEAGRCMAYLAKNADEVIRVFCGIGTKIK